MKIKAAILVFGMIFLPGTLLLAERLSEPYDHSLWSQFLETYVDENGFVDYAAVKTDPSLLNQYLAQIKKIETGDFDGWPREEKLALLLNAYHAGLVSLVIQNYPIDSVQSIPGFWDLPAFFIGKRGYSLNSVKLEDLRVFRSENIHAVLSYGAQSCPFFPSEAFTAPRVEGQIYMIARAFVNDSQCNVIDPESGKVEISKVFKWHEGDYAFNFGSGERPEKREEKNLYSKHAVLSFIAYYLNDAKKISFLEKGKYEVKYLPFDWKLNDSGADSSPAASAAPDEAL